MRDILFTLVLLAAIPIALTSNYWALAFWYWVSFFQPQTQSYGFATSLPFGSIAAGMALLTWFFSKEKKLPPALPLVVLMILLGLWTGLTTLTALFPDVAADKWDVFVKALLMVIVGIAVMQTRERLNILIWTICISIGFYGFKLGLFALAGGHGISFRGPSYMNENNGLARAIIMCLPLMWYLYLQNKHLWIRVGLVGVGLSSLVALVFSGSRGGWIAALSMLAFAKMRTRGILWMIVAVIASLVIIPLLPDSIIHRFISIGDLDTDKSFQGRVGSWLFGLEFFWQRPILGGGFEVFEYEHGKASHNSYFQVLGEHGSVGLLLFVLLLGAYIMATRRIRRETKDRPDLAWAHTLAFMLQVIFVGYCVGSLTINHAFFPLLYAIIGVLASLQIIVRRELQATPVADAVPVSANGLGMAANNSLGSYSSRIRPRKN